VVAVAAGLAVVGQLVGLYLPRPLDGVDWFPGADKLLHAVAFALPVILVPWADTLRRRSVGRPPRPRILVLVISLSVAHAVVSELVQYAAYPDRAGDPLDVLADWAGIAVGGLLAEIGLAGHLAGRGRAPLSAERRPADG
jgi:hypothetical protein